MKAAQEVCIALYDVGGSVGLEGDGSVSLFQRVITGPNHSKSFSSSLQPPVFEEGWWETDRLQALEVMDYLDSFQLEFTSVYSIEILCSCLSISYGTARKGVILPSWLSLISQWLFDIVYHSIFLDWLPRVGHGVTAVLQLVLTEGKSSDTKPYVCGAPEDDDRQTHREYCSVV